MEQLGPWHATAVSDDASTPSRISRRPPRDPPETGPTSAGAARYSDRTPHPLALSREQARMIRPVVSSTSPPVVIFNPPKLNVIPQ